MEAVSTTITNNAPIGISASAKVSRGGVVAGNAVKGNLRAYVDGSHLTRNNDHHHTRNDAHKYNVLVYGLEECKEETPRPRRQCEDMDKVVGSLRGFDKSLSSTSIKDHFRLEKYTKESKKPRPILVKFMRSDDVFRVLTKSREL